MVFSQGPPQTAPAPNGKFNVPTTDCALLSSWQPSVFRQNCCNNTGVACNSQGRVTIVQIINFPLRNSSVPQNINQLDQALVISFVNCSLSGQIPSSIGQLNNLAILDLIGNSLTGPIPDAVAGMSTLRLLALSHNSLTGPIPASIGDAQNLVFLELDNNQLSGPIPSQLASLKKLQFLFVSRLILLVNCKEISSAETCLIFPLSRTSVAPIFPSTLG